MRESRFGRCTRSAAPLPRLRNRWRNPSLPAPVRTARQLLVTWRHATSWSRSGSRPTRSEAQDFLLLEDPIRGSEPPVITIKLKKTSFLSGRLVDEHGQPVAGQLVEVWSNRKNWLPPKLVGFKQGPVRTAADGSFRTPANLLQGSAYRVEIRAPGKDPIISDWITIEDKPHTLAPSVQADASHRSWGRLRPAGKAGCGGPCVSDG